MTNNININDINRLSSIELCIQAQELVQELIFRFPDLNNYLKSSIQGITSSDPNWARFRKLDEHLASIEASFSKLRLYCRIINQRRIDTANNYISDIQSIQLTDQLNQNKLYIIEKITEKNKYLKTILDNLLNIIWQINSFKSL